MSERIIGIGEIAVSDNSEEIIKTYALGSCVAVIVYDHDSGIGGMVHISLSDSKISQNKDNPGHFADSGIDEMLLKIMNLNENIDFEIMDVYIVGGAKMMQGDSFFNIGENNIKKVKSILKGKKMKIKSEDLGKDISRTVSLDIFDGRVIVSNMKIGKWLLT